MSAIMNIDEISDDVMSVMNQIKYGYIDANGDNIIDTDQFGEHYRLQSPGELLNSKVGVCWEQVELERRLFIDRGVNVKTYFIFIDDEDGLPSHTFLTYEFGGKHYWFEHSFAKYAGVHEYKSEEELLTDAARKFRDYQNLTNLDAPMYLFRYQRPEYHIGVDDFYKYIETQTEINLGDGSVCQI